METDLRTALVGGGLVTFAVDGTIELTGTLVITNDTVFDASGRTLVLSGSNAVRVLYVNSGVRFSMTNVTVTQGKSDTGAGLFNAGGTVNLSRCLFIGNEARGTNGQDIPWDGNRALQPGGTAVGGALYNLGNLWIADTLFATNRSIGGNGGSATNSPITFLWETGGSGGIASGGAVYSAGQVLMTNCSHIANQAIGGKGGDATNSYSYAFGGNGGGARGGAICATGTLAMINATFQFNFANGGKGGVATKPTGPPSTYLRGRWWRC